MFSRANLITQRHAAGVSQPRLAAASGLDVNTIRAIEQGRVRNPSSETVERLARALAIPMDSLFVDEPQAEVVA